jgi:hypothetical protein
MSKTLLFGADGRTPIASDTAKEAEGRLFDVQTRANMGAGLGFVRLQVLQPHDAFLLTPFDALALAQSLQRAAYTAMSNIATIKLLVESGGLEPEDAAYAVAVLNQQIYDHHVAVDTRRQETLQESQAQPPQGGHANPNN